MKLQVFHCIGCSEETHVIRQGLCPTCQQFGPPLLPRYALALLVMGLAVFVVLFFL